ncbi:MAG: hypothetical protein U5K69_21260 [Balneolaceae bacterium]|nr:hypothetical protein [Balneolaceae bacterium]
MDNATQILIIGGMLILTYGFFLGIPNGLSTRGSIKGSSVPDGCTPCSVNSGGMLLALTIAFDFLNLASWIKTVAATLFVGGVILFDLGLTLNWLQGVQDAFEKKSFGYKISSAGTPLVLISAAIVVYGVFSAL